MNIRLTEYGEQVELDDDPAVVSGGIGSKDREDRCVFSGLCKKAIDTHRLLRKLNNVPRSPLIIRIAGRERYAK